jgi:hypothetical protein
MGRFLVTHVGDKRRIRADSAVAEADGGTILGDWSVPMSAEQLDPDDDLRRRLDEREFLREAEEAAAQLERSTRTLRDVIDAAMLAGNKVELEVGAVTVSGCPVGTSDSLVQVEAAGVIRYVSLGAVTVVGVVAGDASGSATGAEDLSLMRLLRSLMATPPDGSVQFTTTSGRAWVGRLVGVADDHVELETDDGQLRAIRLESIATIEVWD